MAWQSCGKVRVNHLFSLRTTGQKLLLKGGSKNWQIKASKFPDLGLYSNWQMLVHMFLS